VPAGVRTLDGHVAALADVVDVGWDAGVGPDPVLCRNSGGFEFI